jgi:uncharacterized protein
MDIRFVLIISLATLLIGLSKGGLGGPVPVSLITPLLSQLLHIPVPQAVSVALPLLLVGDLFALRAYWGMWDMRYVKLMLPMAVVGVIVGTVMLARLPDSVLRPLLGTFTLSVVLYKLLSDRITALAYQPREWHGHFVGGAAGFGSAIANAGAPPFTAYMLLQKVEPLIFLGTTTLFFAIVNFLKLPGNFIAGIVDLHLLWSVLFAIPLIPVGVWVGRWAIQHSNPKFFEYLMIFFLFVASISLILPKST